MVTKIILTLLFSILLMADSSTEIFGKLLKQNDIEKAVEWYQTSTNVTNGEATYFVALCLLKGDFGANKDTQKGIDYLKKAINLGSSDAMYELGITHYNGLNVKVDEKEGLYYLNKAISYNNKNALYALGLVNLKSNPKKAFDYLNKASELGKIEAMYDLGVMYAEGNGILKDMIKAKYWISKAYNSGYEKASVVWNHFELWKY